MKGPQAQKVEKMFDSIAPDYDRLNHLLSMGIDRSWRRRALKWIVDPSSKQYILDVACGTGDFSIDIARKSNPASRITGIDLSEGMLSVMREKLEKSGLADSVCAVQGNCDSMDYADGSFDRVSIGFGIRNFEHRESALKEILRVLKPGGRLVILELSIPSVPVLRGLYKLYFLHLLPLVGGVVSGDRGAYRYLPASVLAFPGKDEWMATMRECGFGNVSHRAFSLGICRMYIGEKI